MTPASVSRLKKLLARELSCLLSYLAGAWPWSSAKERVAAGKLQALIAAEQEEQLRLAGLLRKARVAPPGASFPMDYTTAHYVGLDWLLPRLATEQKALIAAAEADAAAADEADRPLFAGFVELKKKHLAALEALFAEDGVKLASTIR